MGMPVFATTTVRGLFGDESDQLFEIGEAALAEADVILTLSVNMNFRLNCGKPPMINADAKFIQIHPSKTHIGYNAPADIGIVAGAGPGAMQLYDAIKDEAVRPKKEWIMRAGHLHADLRKEWNEGYNFKDIEPMHPARCANEEMCIRDRACCCHINATGIFRILFFAGALCSRGRRRGGYTSKRNGSGNRCREPDSAARSGQVFGIPDSCQ